MSEFEASRDLGDQKKAAYEGSQETERSTEEQRVAEVSQKGSNIVKSMFLLAFPEITPKIESELQDPRLYTPSKSSDFVAPNERRYQGINHSSSRDIASEGYADDPGGEGGKLWISAYARFGQYTSSANGVGLSILRITTEEYQRMKNDLREYITMVGKVYTGQTGTKIEWRNPSNRPNNQFEYDPKEVPSDIDQETLNLTLQALTEETGIEMNSEDNHYYSSNGIK